MSDPKLISPLLDNFVMGDPISDKNGIRCCPAMDTASDEKYIVKIISVPASETQLQALLLTGALENEDAAWKYFEDRANDLVRELEILQQLSKQEGFLPCERYQVVPMEDQIGYEVYILTRYKRTLLRQFDKKPLTKLDALNLGLDLCAALNACRRSGYLFSNLKPSNIYVTENGEYKISDLGFISLSALKYAALPQQYVGKYTPPELLDPFSTLNTTMDVYALGMILYEIYNGGILPEDADTPLPPPQYADKELGQIILKACCSEVEERWQDPVQMGQMLVNYMQKNGASDDPIVPPPMPEEEPEPIPEETDPIEQPAADTQQDSDPEQCEERAEEIQINEGEPVGVSEAEEPIAENEQLSFDMEETETVEAIPEETELAQPVDNELSEDVSIDEEPDISYDELSDEVSQILSQADELAAIDVPEPVVAPEPVEVKLPEPEEPELLPEEAFEETSEEESEVLPDETDEEEPSENDEEEKPVKQSHWLRNTLLIILTLALLAGGFVFYKFYYMKTVDDLQLIGNRDTLTVQVTSQVEDELLSISCTDLYGKTVIVPVVNGEAEFSGLAANAEYTIEVNIEGFHGLNGKVSASHFTPAESAIVQYNVVTGNMAGSAILSFTVSGPDSENWKFTYSTSGQEEQTVSFTGHTVTLTGLQQNKVYTGILEPEDDLFIAEATEITFTASDVILAQNLVITECANGKLSAEWTVPEGVAVESWSVRCYNGSDYDQTVTTQETSIVFSDLDHTDSFTVDVTAMGQSYIQTASVGKNSVTVKNLTADASKAGMISLNWEASQIPENGWIVSYTINGSETVWTTATNQNSAEITPAVPGCQYTFTVQAADSSPTICKPCVCSTAEAENFSVNFAGNEDTRYNLFFELCKRPAFDGWTRNDLSDADYTTTFAVGTAAGFVVHLNRQYDLSYDDMVTAFVIRDKNDQIVSVSSVVKTWTDMWHKNYCHLDIPSIPDKPGDYTISVYFDGQFAVTQAFRVVK